MNQVWQLQEAKNKFSRVVDLAQDGTPQIVTRHGVEVAVVLSYEAYRQLMKPQKSIIEFFRASPLVEVELDLERDKSDLRDEFGYELFA